VTETSVLELLAESFGVLAAELPAAWLRFCAALNGRAVELDVDGERFVVRFASGTVSIEAPAGDADARIATTRQTILDVLDARVTLREAVWRDLLQVTAPLTVMEPLHEAILAYVHGGVRCPSFPALLKRFRILEQRSPQ
jgi:hypothetical protein